ncbi:MAG TPA: integrin alpha, partial [Planctomycetota bacterium]|nr:integrin alpha [Planctomycetota bacterium]
MADPTWSRLGIVRGPRVSVAFALGLLGSTSGLARGQGFLLAESSGTQGANHLGWAVASAGDVDGDAVPDLLLGAALSGPHGRVNVISGASGGLLLGLIGLGWDDGFGAAVASVGDVNGDGVPDVAVGAPHSGLLFGIPLSGNGPGSVTLFSGADGAVLFTVAGTFPDEGLGGSVSGTGDVDGDGVPDLIVGAPGADPGGILNAGAARILSGANGAVLRAFDGTAPWDQFGASVAGAGDLDGDGFGDVLVGAPFALFAGWSDAGLAQVFSGGSGAILFTLSATSIGNAELGTSVAGSEDLNGDGVPDLLVGAPEAFGAPGLSQAGQVRAYSGATGALLLTLTGGASSEHLGGSVAAAGDVDGDGVPDIVAGAPEAFVPLGVFNTAGRARVFSGASGAPLFSFAGTDPDENLGWSVAGAGDLNGDGASEFLVGAPFASLGLLGTNGGRVSLHSGATGAALSVFDGNVDGERSGFALAVAGDVNGDGIPDAIAGSPYARVGLAQGAGRARVLSGTNGAVLLELSGSNAGDRFGWSAAGGEDLDGDGVPDMVIGAPNADPSGLADAGQVVVRSGSGGGPVLTVDGTAAFGTFAYSVAFAGDVNGDGIPDLAAGAPGVGGSGAPGAGAARILSGADGSTLLVVSGVATNERLGRSVAGIGDVDGDGVPDFAAGAPNASPSGLSSAGAARVFSGANGALLLALDGTGANEAWEPPSPGR